MQGNYFKTLLRNFGRQKPFILINISGLTLGITCSLVLFLIVKHEWGFNRYHENIDSIYRIGSITFKDGQEYTGSGVPKPFPKAIEQVSGIKKVTFVSHRGYGLFEVTGTDGQVDYYEESPEVVYVEPSFFEVFTWPWIEGNAVKGLSAPNTVALTRKIADKYFPGGNAIGKTIRYNQSTDLKVVGILENAPVNSDFPFGIFISMATMEARQDMSKWNSISSDDVCFVLLEEQVTAENVEQQLPGFIDRHYSENSNAKMIYTLQPFNEYHFDMRFGAFSYRQVSKNILLAYSLIGLFLIITACFNFINLSTAMAVRKAREAGIRKVLGSSRNQLVFHFLGETFWITLVAIIISMAMTERLLPLVINDFVGTTIVFNLTDDPAIIFYLFSLLVFVTLLAGLYPAFILSRAKPVEALKGGFSTNGKKGLLRKVLVIFQFTLSQMLVLGTIITLLQYEYFSTVDMGYNKEWVLNVPMDERDKQTQVRWASEIQSLPGIKSYSFNYKPPFSGSVSATNAVLTREEGITGMEAEVKMADGNYMKVYGLQLLSGEWLLDSDTVNRYVVNETFVRKAGFQTNEEAIGVPVKIWGKTYPIVGVVKDFHTGTLQNKVEPVVLFNDVSEYSTLGMKIEAGHSSEIIKGLEKIWKGLHPEYNFNYYFLDDRISEYYDQEKRMSQMLTAFAGIAILIGCLGLYGLVAFMANQRTREIGIRKVLGASVSSIVGIFSWEFVRLVMIAFVIAAPLAYVGMSRWLDTYVYRIDISPMVFIIGIGISIVIALLTTGYRSLKAAHLNPVDSLRDE